MADANPTPGRIVRYVLSDGRAAGESRPAIIVRVFDPTDTKVQLQVFTDGMNDGLTRDTGSEGIMWKTSVPYDPDGALGTWHWPPRS